MEWSGWVEWDGVELSQPSRHIHMIMSFGSRAKPTNEQSELLDTLEGSLWAVCAKTCFETIPLVCGLATNYSNDDVLWLLLLGDGDSDFWCSKFSKEEVGCWGDTSAPPPVSPPSWFLSPANMTLMTTTTSLCSGLAHIILLFSCDMDEQRYSLVAGYRRDAHTHSN